MVLEITHSPAFGCEQLPLTARNGAGILRLVVKSAYTYASGTSVEQLGTPPKVLASDEYWDDPLSKHSVRLESDVSLHKPHTDLIVNGCAVAPRAKKVRSMAAGISYQGKALQRAKVVGDRVWTKAIGGWVLSDPLPFERIPITWARAYGGADAGGMEARNPVGTGYVSKLTAAFEGTRVPNIEHPDRPITAPTDRPQPVSFGVVARHAQSRMQYAGTYDAAWLEERFPLLPDDFDDRFNQCVDPRQWIARPVGGEIIQIEGMSELGMLAMTVPPCRLAATFHYRGRQEKQELDLDSIVVDTDAATLTLTWRAVVDVRGDPFQLLETVVDSDRVGRAAPARCC